MRTYIIGNVHYIIHLSKRNKYMRFILVPIPWCRDTTSSLNVYIWWKIWSICPWSYISNPFGGSIFCNSWPTVCQSVLPLLLALNETGLAFTYMLLSNTINMVTKNERHNIGSNSRLDMTAREKRCELKIKLAVVW